METPNKEKAQLKFERSILKTKLDKLMEDGKREEAKPIGIKMIQLDSKINKL